MRIALLSWESLNSIAVGGVAVHTTALAGALQRRGHCVHVFTRVGPGQRTYDRADGVHYHRCAFHEDNDFIATIDRMNGSFLSRIHEVESTSDDYFDVVHAHDWLCVPGLVRAKNEMRRRTVLTMHSTEYGRCGNQLCEGPSRRIRDIEWEGTYVAQRVICVSRALTHEIHEVYRTPLDKLCPIYNGVDVRPFDGRVDSRSVKRRYGIRPNAPTILFAGRMTRQKGPDLLLSAIPRVLNAHPDAAVVFAGDGDMRPALEHGARSAGISPATRFVGHKSGQELVNLFRSADVVCVPSRNEPFGIVVLEAWSARKPVVATRNGGPAEFVRHEHNGLTVRADADAIGWGLRVALHDAKHARRLGRNGRRAAESRFSWDQIAVETEDVYRTVIESKAPRYESAPPNKESYQPCFTTRIEFDGSPERTQSSRSASAPPRLPQSVNRPSQTSECAPTKNTPAAAGRRATRRPIGSKRSVSCLSSTNPAN